MTALTAAQARALRRLDGGGVVYAYDGVSRATAYALVRRDLAEWAVEPHAVSQRAPTPGSRIRYQLELGVRAVTITWHLHPTVWQHAVLGRHEAQIWGAEEDGTLDWAVYPAGSLVPAAAGTGTGEADAKAQAEAALRRLNAA